MKFKRGDYFKYVVDNKEILIGRITCTRRKSKYYPNGFYYYICLFCNVDEFVDIIGEKSFFTTKSKMERDSEKIEKEDILLYLI